MAVETERKYLIEYPDLSRITSAAKRVIEITQTYLKGGEGEDVRVRCAKENGKITYTHTVKTRISRLSRNETEREISESEYQSLLTLSDPNFIPLKKTRYCINVPSGHIAEIDIYVSVTEYAICELELKDESETPSLPDEITLIREVTGEKEYTNRVLAKNPKNK